MNGDVGVLDLASKACGNADDGDESGELLLLPADEDGDLNRMVESDLFSSGEL